LALFDGFTRLQQGDLERAPKERDSVRQAGTATGKLEAWRIEPFVYPAGVDAPSQPDWGGLTLEAEMAGEQAARDQTAASAENAIFADFEKRLAEEARKSFEAGRERGRQEGRQAQREAQAAAVATAEEQRMLRAAELAEGFARERERYLSAVEHEVVKLALMVAARILRREAQMDPLLLTGAVRVALGQLSSSTRVRLRVPQAEQALWTETILRLPNLAVRPEVVPGEGMQLGECMVETEMGSVDLGVRTQLGEIERGFFDRVGRGTAEVSPPTDPSMPDQSSSQKDRL
jgi:flagellar assembly protein FliH